MSGELLIFEDAVSQVPAEAVVDHLHGIVARRVRHAEEDGAAMPETFTVKVVKLEQHPYEANRFVVGETLRRFHWANGALTEVAA